MPWADSRGVEPAYVRLTWYPPRGEMDDALAFVQELAVNGFEYEDGQVGSSPFTDIPLAPGRPFVRVYLPQSDSVLKVSRIAELCQRRGWTVEQDLVQSADWANAWKEHYHPEPISHGYMIVPAWYETSPVDPAHTLWLDPGMAFGTGTHATTRLCLRALARLPIFGKRVLDLGAGSGILGLFAGLRQAGRVVMVEPDPVAVDAIFHNARMNRLDHQMEVVRGTLKDVDPAPYDILCLNLIWDIIAFEWDALPAYLAPGARLLLSGILEERRDDVRTMVERSGNRLEGIVAEEGWLMAEVHHDFPRA